MTRFRHRSADTSGVLVHGELDATDLADAARQLRQRGLEPLRVTPGATGLRRLTGGRRSASVFVRALASLLRGDRSLERALRTLSAQSGPVGAMARDLLPDILAGRTPADAFARRSDVFPVHFAAAAAAGQASGSLAAALADLASDEERRAKLLDELHGALVYPAILAGAAAAAVTFLLVGVIPKFGAMFADMGTPPPAPLAGLLALSAFLRAQWPPLLAALAGAGVLARMAWRDQALRAHLDHAALRTPLLGPLISTALAARFFRSLELLLRNGLSAAPALGAARHTVGNAWARQQLDRAYENVRTGRSPAQEIAAADFLPPLSTALLAAAEESGALLEGAQRLATLYEEDLDRRIKVLVRVAEPVFVGLAGVVVGAIMLSLVSALVSVNEAIAA